MNKSRIIPIALLLLIAAVLLLLFRPWRLLTEDHGFQTLRSREGIDRIVLSSPVDSIALLQKGGDWFLYGEEPVNPVAIENLFFASERMNATSMVRETPGDRTYPWKRTDFYRGIQAVYGFEFRQVENRFQVRLVKPRSSREGTYYVAIPGFPDLNLEKVFSLVPGHYREHLLVNLVPSEVKRVEVDLAGGESFQFEKDGEGRIRFIPAGPGFEYPESEPDSLATALLFSYFTGIVYDRASPFRAEQVLSDDSGFPWLGTVRVASVSGEEHQMAVYAYPEDENGQPRMFEALVVHNEHPYALVVNYIYLDVLLRGSAHYFDFFSYN